MKSAPVLMQADDLALAAEPSTLLAEAIEEYETSRPELDQDQFRNSAAAWSLLANQVVGHENL